MKTKIIKTQKQFDSIKDDFYGRIEIVGDLNCINRIFKNAYLVVDGGTIQYVDGGTIHSVDGGTIHSVYGGTIQYVGGNSVLQISKDFNIPKVKMNAIIICIDCDINIKEKAKTVQIIKTTKAKYTKNDFLDIYDSKRIGKTKIKLIKSVNPDTLCDFYTGTIKYEGIVNCSDFDDNENIQCGRGLHLSALPEQALSYNHQGKLLECEVNIKDFVVYPDDISKVRCKKVKVIGEIE